MRRAWEAQEQFTRKVLPVTHGVNLDSPEMVEARTRLTRDYVLSMMSELAELLRELPDWKMHRAPEAREVVETNVQEELADLQKFLWGLAMIWGLDYRGMGDQVLLKSMVVDVRWRQEHEMAKLLETKKVAVVDIDGVLAEWPAPLDRFRDRFFPGLDLADLVNREKVKHAYRVSDFQQKTPMIPGGGKVLRKLKERGFVVVILTRRPYHLYKREFYDTVLWLKRRKIPYDHIYWAAGEKYQTMLSWAKNIALTVDDELVNCTQFRNMGLKTYWMMSDRGTVEEAHDIGAISIRNLEEMEEVR